MDSITSCLPTHTCKPKHTKHRPPHNKPPQHNKLPRNKPPHSRPLPHTQALRWARRTDTAEWAFLVVVAQAASRTCTCSLEACRKATPEA